MTDKILFWLYANFMYFGLTKYMRDLYNCELYAIIDITDKSKKFFQEQKLVEFKNIWFYHDYVSKFTKPDLQYLSVIEKTYKVNLWLLASNERIFSEYNEYYKFTSDQILSILEQECKLFESVLDEVKPDFIIMASPNFHYDHLFYSICKARGIRILIQGPSRFGHRCIISEKVDEIDSKQVFQINTTQSIEQLQNYLKGFDITKEGKELTHRFTNSKIQYFQAALSYLGSANTNLRTHYTYFGRTKINVLKNAIKNAIIEKYRRYFIDKNFVREIDEKTPYVYFPLTTEPESTLLVYAPFFTNQIELIRNISKSLPIEYRLIVKDHPLQSVRGWRKTSYYKEIMKLPNVVMVHHSFPSEQIIKKSSLVITIASTAGMEAAFYEKPSIVLGDVLYSSLPSVHKLKSIEELPEAIRKSLEKKVDIVDLNKFVNYINQNSFEFNLTGMDMDYVEKFFHGGYLVDVEINEQDVKSFLEDPQNREKFELIANEHIKKIKQFKETSNQ
jgi:hypothetical protein